MADNHTITAPIDEWRDVRHAVKTAIVKHQNKMMREQGYKRASAAKHAARLRTFLDRLPDVKYTGGGET